MPFAMQIGPGCVSSPCSTIGTAMRTQRARNGRYAQALHHSTNVRVWQVIQQMRLALRRAGNADAIRGRIVASRESLKPQSCQRLEHSALRLSTVRETVRTQLVQVARDLVRSSTQPPLLWTRRRSLDASSAAMVRRAARPPKVNDALISRAGHQGPDGADRGRVRREEGHQGASPARSSLSDRSQEVEIKVRLVSPLLSPVLCA